MLLTDKQEELIIGSLLGDGFLEKSRSKKPSGSFRIVRKLDDIGYLNFEYEILQNLCTASGIKELHRFDKRTNKTYHSCHLRTKCLEYFYNLHNKWYVCRDNKNIKIVPLDLKLTPLILAIWFCDDGYLRSKTKNSLELLLATNGFSFPDVEFLVSLLKERYKENFYLSVHNKKEPVIYCSTYGSKLFMDDILPIFPDSMHRKIPENFKNISLDSPYIKSRSRK